MCALMHSVCVCVCVSGFLLACVPLSVFPIIHALGSLRVLVLLCACVLACASVSACASLCVIACVLSTASPVMLLAIALIPEVVIQQFNLFMGYRSKHAVCL